MHMVMMSTLSLVFTIQIIRDTPDNQFGGINMVEKFKNLSILVQVCILWQMMVKLNHSQLQLKY